MPKGPLGILGRPLAREECSLVYSMFVPPGDEGQVIQNINPDYPGADIEIKEDEFRGDRVKAVIIDTGRHRLNVQNDVLQFQPRAEVDVEFLWPKATALSVRYMIDAPAEELRPLRGEEVMFWSFELSEEITQEEYDEFAEDPDNKAWANMTDFKLSSNGQAIYTDLPQAVGIRNTKQGILRRRSFVYDALLGPTADLPLREGRNSDIITCVRP